jgi:hypothetical protein
MSNDPERNVEVVAEAVALSTYAGVPALLDPASGLDLRTPTSVLVARERAELARQVLAEDEDEAGADLVSDGSPVEVLERNREHVDAVSVLVDGLAQRLDDDQAKAHHARPSQSAEGEGGAHSEIGELEC